MGSRNVIAGLAAAAIAAQAAIAIAQGESSLLRPPGIQGEKDFASRCVKCGKCLEACPYKSIVAAGLSAGAAAGSPCIDARACACRLCEDFPCVAACPTGALRDVKDRSDVHMGYAKIEQNICLAYAGMRCEVCYRNCPLIDEAIWIDYQAKQGDAIHSLFIPVIDPDVCTGCGLCVERCVVDHPRVAIKIVTRGEQERKAKKD